jgi:hypothetical protein
MIDSGGAGFYFLRAKPERFAPNASSGIFIAARSPGSIVEGLDR